MRAVTGLTLSYALLSITVPALAEPAPSASAAVDPASISAKMDAYLQVAVRYDHFIGTVLVARDDVPIFAQSYGMADYEQGVPNRPDTVFAVASITKQFTALAIMQLQERGKLNVNDPICRYLEDCPASWKPITIRHLLTHTSGIPNFSSLPDWDEKMAMIDYRRRELVALFRDLPLGFAPGEKYAYSNSGYVLAGMIVERVSGERFGDYLSKHIFTPAGMKHSYYEEGRALVPGRARGYYSVGTTFINGRLVSATNDLGNSGINTTAGDLLLWEQAFSADRLISRRSREAMLTPVKEGYGYGLRIGEKFGRQQYNHSGSKNGFSIFLVRFPAERLTTIVLSNSDKASAGGTGFALSAIALGEPYKLPKAQLNDILWDVIVADGVPAALERYRELKRIAPKDHDFSHEALVGLGYDLVEARKLTEAGAIFDYNLEQFPDSAWSYDGLADVAVARGDSAKAMALFEKSLGMDPDNSYAEQALARLRAEKIKVGAAPAP